MPEAPVRVGAGSAPDGDGGYVVRHHDTLFQGESNFGARYDFTDPRAPTEIARIQMSGDFDTLVPIGNVAVGSVDEGAEPGRATLVFPWDTAPDARGLDDVLIRRDSQMLAMLAPGVVALYAVNLSSVGGCEVLGDWLPETGVVVPGRVRLDDTAKTFKLVIVSADGGVTWSPGANQWKLGGGGTLTVWWS